jgi:hypothetical protein
MTNAPAVPDDAMQDRQRCTEHCKQHLNIPDLMKKRRNEGASKDCVLTFRHIYGQFDDPRECRRRSRRIPVQLLAKVIMRSYA